MPPTFDSMFYTQAFTHTIDEIKSIYYATSEMNAQTFSQSYPGNPSLNFIWYEIDAFNYSYTHLTTRVRGYFQVPYFYQLTAKFLIVLAKNPFIDNYLVLNYI